MRLLSVKPFWACFLSAWLFYFILLPLVSIYKFYEVFPAVAFIGYTIIIALNLMAIAYSNKRLHFILLSFSLMIIGAIASLDMILHKEQMAEFWKFWNAWGIELTEQSVTTYVQVLIILLNIFTGSIAAQCLFNGLMRNDA